MDADQRSSDSLPLKVWLKAWDGPGQIAIYISPPYSSELYVELQNAGLFVIRNEKVSCSEEILVKMTLAIYEPIMWTILGTTLVAFLRHNRRFITSMKMAGKEYVIKKYSAGDAERLTRAFSWRHAAIEVARLQIGKRE